MAYANEPTQALVPIWLFCNVYVLADNDVTITGRARAATRCFHWQQGKTICIISNSAWPAKRDRQDLYKIFKCSLFTLECLTLTTSLGISHANIRINVTSSETRRIALPDADKKLIRRWDSERELFTTTSYTHYKFYLDVNRWPTYQMVKKYCRKF